ncbi:MAG: chemotaxis protein CheW [Acidobacteriota bacterium]|nr:chemotaxis protein CheW [Acidobacteriota bacterium]
MSTNNSLFGGDSPATIFHIGDRSLALPAFSVREMIAMPPVTPVPRTPPWVRGAFNLRGRLIPVVDLRVKLGMRPLEEELNDLVQLLGERQKDHLNWLEELEASVREGREFRLATDPTKCKFGRWLAGFHTNNPLLQQLLGRFSEPHQGIHAIAIEVGHLITRNDNEAALKTINNARHGLLDEMIRLFERTRTMLRETTREIAIVLEHDDVEFAISIDTVDGVEHLAAKTIEELPNMLGGLDEDVFAGAARRERDGSVVLLLDLGALLPTITEKMAQSA